MNLHDVIKYYKTGISKVTDHAVREIRHGRISKKDALDLVKYHQTFDPLYIDMFCDWLGIDEKSLQYVLDMHRNKDIWKIDDNRNWILKNKSNTNSKNKSVKDFSFKINSSFSRDFDDGYITIGKGHP